ncbi:MAG: tetratricopeptide repeat protein [Anaerolineae bacterium]|nr:tetratricopeptide repeat protein [Anaerolineae bacterium]
MKESNSESAEISAHSTGDRLESWKEIASYLNRTVRTVRRWEKQEGLPVHRHLHKKLGTVYAYKAEIDTWWESRRARLENQPEQMDKVATRQIRRAAVLVLALVGILAAGAYLAWNRNTAKSPALPAKVMLAVLPFENLSGNPDQEYFSDGLTEEMITELGRLRPERLGVIARTSVMQYKQTTRNTQQIGRDLGVDYLLEGGVRREGDRVRISAQLIQVSDQTHLWAESYDRPLRNILQLQRDVARNIAATIRLQLTSGQQAALASTPTVEPKAYEAYLRGRYFWGKRTPEGLQKALAYLEQALEADPRFALAQADLAGVYSMMSWYGVLPPREAYLRAHEAALRALEMDANLAEAHAVLATVKERLEWDWAGAEKAFRRAVKLNPNYPTAHHWYGLFLERMGQLEKAKAHMQQALKLDPISLIINKNAADPFFYAGEYDRAITQYQKTLELAPEFLPARLFMGFAYEQQGRLADAITQFEQARALGDRPAALGALGHAYARAGRVAEARHILEELGRLETYVDPYHVALIHVGLGEEDEAFRWLEKAFDERSEWLLHVKIDPRLKSLRSHPAFQNLLRRMNLLS